MCQEYEVRRYTYATRVYIHGHIVLVLLHSLLRNRRLTTSLFSFFFYIIARKPVGPHERVINSMKTTLRTRTPTIAGAALNKVVYMVISYVFFYARSIRHRLCRRHSASVVLAVVEYQIPLILCTWYVVVSFSPANYCVVLENPIATVSEVKAANFKL